jgi:transposase-like protein
VESSHVYETHDSSYDQEPITCPHCEHYNLDPKRNRANEYVCENCGGVLPERDAEEVR